MLTYFHLPPIQLTSKVDKHESMELQKSFNLIDYFYYYYYYKRKL